MKKHFLSITALALIAGTLVFTGCSKDDVTAPVVTLVGGDVTISLQGTYTEAGATATDDKDGEISPVVGGDVVDVNKTGVYVVTYTATDAAGNVGEATRNVTVKNDAEASWAGTYAGKETDVNGPWTYVNPVIVTASKTINNQIIINPLGDYKNNAVYANVVGTTISIPNQNHTNVGSPQTPSDPCDVHNRQTSSGTGAKTATGFTLNYADAKLTPCTGSRTSVDAVFTKQ